MIFFFNGFAVGGSIVIGYYFGAKKQDHLHKAVETTIAIALLFGIFFTIVLPAAGHEKSAGAIPRLITQ